MSVFNTINGPFPLTEIHKSALLQRKKQAIIDEKMKKISGYTTNK